MPISDTPQLSKQHAVPQNIMDVEFKIVGELTMRQFSYLIIFGLLSYFSFVIVPGIFKWPIVLTSALLAISLAFIPVQERGLDEWLVNFFRAINTPTERVWEKEPQIPTAFMYDNLALVKQEMITLAPTSSRRKLEEYLRKDIDKTNEDPLDIPEKAYAMKVREAFPDEPRRVRTGLMLEEPLDEQKEFEEEEKTSDVEESPDGKVDETKETVKVEEGVVSDSKDGEEKKKPEPSQAEKKKKAPATIIKSRSSYGKSVYDYSGRRPPYGQGYSEGYDQSVYPVYSGYGSMANNVHSGRKFINLVPSSGGEIVLPIRGQRVIDTSESTQVKTDIEEKAKKLNELLDRIRAEEGIPAKVPHKKPQGEEEAKVVDKEAGEVFDSLKKQNEDLSSEIERLRSQIARNKSMSLETEGQEQLLKKLEAQKEEIASSYAELSSQVQDLRKKLQEKEEFSTGESFEEGAKMQLPVLTDKPNVVSGVVRDSGGKFFSDYLVIIKNSRGDTVRAFKTNSLGQFIVSTPLQNGTYTVEVSPTNKTDLSFGIIPVEVKGGIIPTLDIVGK